MHSNQQENVTKAQLHARRSSLACSSLPCLKEKRQALTFLSYLVELASPRELTTIPSF